MIKHKTVLGLSLGTRRIGVAVIRNGDLREWQVKEFKGVWNKRKVEAVVFYIYKLCGFYRTRIIAIRIPKESTNRTGIRRVMFELQEYAEKQGFRLLFYSLTDVRKHYSCKVTAQGKHLAEMLTALKPELSHDLKRDARNLNSYYNSMFEAVAVAVMASDEDL